MTYRVLKYIEKERELITNKREKGIISEIKGAIRGMEDEYGFRTIDLLDEGYSSDSICVITDKETQKKYVVKLQGVNAGREIK